MGIAASVGRDGTNNPDDVIKIQKLINEQYQSNATFKDAMKEPLKVENKCTDATITAIETFQKVVLKMTKPDGRVDTPSSSLRGQTWQGLNGNVLGTQAVKRMNGGYTVFSQLDYDNIKIGNSNKSIAKIGCTLTTLTMAATAVGSRTDKWPAGLQPKDLDPPAANNILKKSGAFSGGELDVPGAAKALGMTYKEYGRNTDLTGQDLNMISNHLAKGFPVAAHVDYKNSDIGDHWILLMRKNVDGSYAAIDPLKAGEIRLQTSPAKNTYYKGDRARQKTGVLFGTKGNQDINAGPKTKKQQQIYIVVRVGLLSPVGNTAISATPIMRAPDDVPEYCSKFNLIISHECS
jgi:hypothetical protein